MKKETVAQKLMSNEFGFVRSAWVPPARFMRSPKLVVQLKEAAKAKRERKNQKRKGSF